MGAIESRFNKKVCKERVAFECYKSRFDENTKKSSFVVRYFTAIGT